MNRKDQVNRRSLCMGMAVAPFALSAVFSASAQGRFPTVVIPFVPGGATDIFGRLYANALGGEGSEKYIVENRGGAGGAIGLAHVASAVPDGRTVLYTYGNLSIALPLTVKDAPDILRDFEPVIRTIVTQGLIVTAANSPMRSFADLLKMAKAEPGKVTFGDYGELTLAHLMRAAGIDLMRVPYKGGVPAMVDVISGQVDIYAGSAAQLAPQVKGGKLRVLAVTSEERVLDFPDVPTVREVFPGYRALNYQGVFVRKGTPPAVIDALYKQSLAAITKPHFQQQAAAQYAAVKPMNPAEFKKFMEADAVDIAAAIKLAPK